MLEDFEAERERWLREEIPARLGELKRDRGIPAETVFRGSRRVTARSRRKPSRQMEYRVVFHPKAEAELEQFYDDIADRASPVIAWNFIVGISDHCLACRLFHSAAQSG
ncbi:hypothetical protein SAMN03159463_05988 [Mesorhizobium sp. NFR06]|uniref:hypothetical protein n=1 Tax=Mesorhizobium sp. NFR06 TaxID=1566290 RepID=UPI0008E00819|nr:hypothetical protein SAMN03159463_05988 [Mesorhizobium sp. NFR06]